MYTPFSAGKTFGNQETKIILCAFSHSIYSSPIHNLFAVSFGMKSQKRPMQLSYLLFCSIAEQSMRLQSFAQWILPIPIQPFRDPGPSRISKLRLPPAPSAPPLLRLVHSLRVAIVRACEPKPFSTSRSHFLRAPKVPAKNIQIWT